MSGADVTRACSAVQRRRLVSGEQWREPVQFPSPRPNRQIVELTEIAMATLSSARVVICACHLGALPGTTRRMAARAVAVIGCIFPRVATQLV